MTIPRVVEDLWGIERPGRRGPKPATSLAAVAREAIAIADAEGLAAVSMSAVAKRLGFTTMALYRYVESREDLEIAMADVALGEPPTVGDRGWRREIDAWARAELTVLLAHPWVLEVRPGTPPLGPGSLGWMDAGLQALGRSDIPPEQIPSCLLLVDGYVRNQVLLAQQFDRTDGWEEGLRAVIDHSRLPALATALDAGAFDDSTEDSFPGDEFEFGLYLLLDGIERLNNPRSSS